MSIDGARLHFRRREMQLMTSTCTVTRRGTETWNETTGQYDYTLTTVYTGKCRLSYPSRTAGDVEAGGSAYAVSDYVVTLPIDTDVQVDDTITVNTSTDPLGDGLTLVVETVPKSDWQVVRKVLCREYTQETT